MNKFNFNQSGGFPLETNILDEMQKAYEIFNALGSIAGNFSIISGCEVTGSTAADGFVYINGELLPFVGGTVGANVKIVETVEALEFEDLNTRDVLYTRHATFGTAAVVYTWADFLRPIPTKDLAALFAGIAETFATIIDKLDTIDRDAKVQEPTDWNATTGVTRLLNKPAIESPFLLKGVYTINDVNGADNLRTVNLASTVSNANYMVVGCLVSNGSDYNIDNDVIFMIRDRTVNSFKLCLREISGHVQNLDFHYALIQL